MKIPIREYWQLLAKYLKPYWLSAVLLTLLLFSQIALQLINPQIVRYFIDTAQKGATPDVLLPAALWFIVLSIIQQVIAVSARYTGENLAWKTTNALRSDLAGHSLRLDLSFHNAHTAGEMIERLDGDVTTLANFFSQFYIQLVGSSLLLLGIIGFLFGVDWRVGLALTGFALAAVTIMLRFRNIAVPHWTAERQASAELYGFLEERLAGTEDIRSNGAEAYVMRKFYQLMRALMQRSLKAALMVNILLNSMFFLFSAGTATAFALGAYLFQHHMVTIGTVYIVYFYTNMLENPINTIVHQLGDLQKAGAGIVRIRELLETQSKVKDAGITLTVDDQLGPEDDVAPLAVEFRQVSFGYDDSLAPSQEAAGEDGEPSTMAAEKEMALEDISFKLKAGSVLGLLGRTGSGKTTLSRLLFRLYDPNDGSIHLGTDGKSTGMVDIRQLPMSCLRRQIGMVTQNIQLFNASVRDNLTFFDRSVPDLRILDVIEALGLQEWFRKLPEGLDTLLETGGRSLSAGEAQLLAFLRIFLKNPRLVVLDEASSRLDPATEALIESAVHRLVQGRTAIIIAHRLATIQRADDILVLENGHILEFGERVRLASDPASHFYRLLKTGMEEVLV